MAIISNPAVFLDRDGVIIHEKDFIIDPDKLEFIPGSLDALKRIPPSYKKIIVSNQSGIGRGYFTANQVERFNDVLLARIKKYGASIDKIYYCPHTPEDNCNCRKPKPGLFEKARQQFNIDFSGSWMIGDKSSDIRAGKNIGAATILVLTGYGGKERNSLDVAADYVVNNLYEAVEIIKS
ncbi:MAG: D-glycero-beta-D-manno-heptose 1,7-bisphosphate 7-phosphatase [candidate division Zixibacteria bacterium]|nr:D-glycero-beta-D-manno-heptose 1,7-bisphosphate 7-phosphatase [candidate division Zixibacteria bacterium]